MFSTIPIKHVSAELPDPAIFASDVPYGSIFICRQRIDGTVPDGYVRAKVLGENIAELRGP
jgi:uncharacterized protein